MATEHFENACRDIEAFLVVSKSSFGKMHLSWAYEYAIVRLYTEFERMMLECLVGAINNDSSHLSTTTGHVFPKHLSDDVCEYLVVGDGYFDFKGRDGLIGELKKFIPDTHFVTATVKQAQYKTSLDRLCALRNFAAHQSAIAKKRARNAVGQQKLGSCGAWLKCPTRFSDIMRDLTNLSAAIRQNAPF